MKKQILVVFLAVCMICSLSACGGGGAVSGEGSSPGQAAGKGIFSAQGGWKDETGENDSVMLLEADGTACTLSKVIIPEGTDGLNNSNLNIPDLVKATGTWEEDDSTITIKLMDKEFTYEKKKDGSKETISGYGYSLARLEGNELKEYEEKAASLQDIAGGAAVSAGGSSGNADAGAEMEDFKDVILFDDDLVTIELVKFYEEEVNWGYSSGPLMEKYFTVKVKNKSDKELLFDLRDAYIHDESVTLAMMDGNQGPAPGKTKTYTYNVYYNTNPEHTPLDSIEDLYTLDAAVDVRIRGENNRGDSQKRIVFSDVLNGSAGGSAQDSAASASSAADAAREDSVVTETDYMTIDGLYADKSYSTTDNDNMRFLYVVYTAHTNGKNMKIDCKSMKITVNDTNTYNAVRSKDQIRYMKNYYNGAYLKEVNIGDSVKFVETFEIPAAELEAGRTIRISKSQIPDSDKIRLSTDQIVFCDSPEEIAQKVDPEGYEKEVWALQDADGEVVAAVKSEINGYQWNVSANSINYEIEFWEPDNYEVRTAISTSGGTYVVKNGYIVCTNDIGGVIEVPYTYENGTVKIDSIAAFDFMK